MTLRLLLVFSAIATVAFAADLKLSDGRVLKDYQILGQTPTTVMVRHNGGAVKVAKALLPEELLKTYPVDAQAAAKEAEENARGKELYDAQRRATEEKKAKDHEAFLAEVRRKLDIEEAKKAKQREQDLKYETSRAAAAEKAAAEKQNNTLTRTVTRQNTARSWVTETVALTLPPPAKRTSYFVEYEVTGDAGALDVRCGEGGRDRQFTGITTRDGWRRMETAKSGERVYLWSKNGVSGGGEFTARIRVDGVVVREAVAGGHNVEAEVSLTLP